MKAILSEKTIVVVLFVMVLVTFSLAQEDSKKKLTKIYSGIITEQGSRYFTKLVTPEQTAPAMDPMADH